MKYENLETAIQFTVYLEGLKEIIENLDTVNVIPENIEIFGNGQSVNWQPKATTKDEFKKKVEDVMNDITEELKKLGIEFDD